MAAKVCPVCHRPLTHSHGVFVLSDACGGWVVVPAAAWGVLVACSCFAALGLLGWGGGDWVRCFLSGPPCAQRRGAPMACHRSTVEGGGGASAGGGRHCSATTAATAVAAGATCRSDCPGDGRGRPGCGSPNAVPTAWPACGNRAPGPRRSSPLGLPRCHDCQ